MGLLVAATVLGLFESSQVQYDRAVQGTPITWSHALIHGLPRWYAWAVLVPAIMTLSRRISQRSWPLSAMVAVHFFIAPVIVALQVFLFSSASTAMHGNAAELIPHLKPAFLKYVGLTFLSGLVIYSVIVLGWHGWTLVRSGRSRERESARLETRAAEFKALLAEAQLTSLQHQLQPHFLFNALHTLNALILAGKLDESASMTQRIAAYLRQTLELSGQREIELRHELELLENYLEIQRCRYGERLRTTVEVDAAVMDVRVPTLMLQPVVENAIRHGLERKADAGLIHIRACRRGDSLMVRVSDDGPGLDGLHEAGIGLSNSRARLAELYDGRASLDLTERPGGGVRVILRIPLDGRAENASPGARLEDKLEESPA